MNKKYMAINALIICIGLGIILGLIYEKNNTKQEQNESNTSEYSENSNKLETELEESNRKYESYSESLKEERKITRELLNIIEKANFEENEYQDVVDNVMDRFYRYAFTMHALPYCGEHSDDIGYTEKKDGTFSQYWESYTFKNKENVNNFFLEFLSENYYNSKIEKYYLENENKLYCYAPGKGAYIYKPEKSDFKVISTSDSKIEVFAKTISDNLGTDTGVDAYATLIYENGNWVVDQYKEY